MLRLAREVPNDRGAQGRGRRPAGTAHLAAQVPAGFEVYSGDDVMTLPLLAVGAVGVVSVAAHWVGPQLRRVVDAFVAGDLAAAIAGNAELLDSFDFESTAGVPQPAAGQGDAAAPWACRSASAACPWARPPPSSTPRRPKILAAVGPPAVTVAPLG